METSDSRDRKHTALKAKSLPSKLPQSPAQTMDPGDLYPGESPSNPGVSVPKANELKNFSQDIDLEKYSLNNDILDVLEKHRRPRRYKRKHDERMPCYKRIASAGSSLKSGLTLSPSTVSDEQSNESQAGADNLSRNKNSMRKR